ncbi:hypothetical protein DYH09_09640 [bacterium CPR1]|nr:hypothetical protein [bacterium CPR1]
MLRAIARNDWPACTLIPRMRGGPRVEQPDDRYWEQFGDLWSEEARTVLRAVREDRVVRFRMTELGKRRCRVRKVLSLGLMRSLAQRALARIRLEARPGELLSHAPQPVVVDPLAVGPGQVGPRERSNHLA